MLLDVTNAKTTKGFRSARAGDTHYLTGVLYMAPADVAAPAGKTVCPWANACKATCLNFAGNRAYSEGKRDARARRTQQYYSDKAGFLREIAKSIETLQRYAEGWPQKPAMPIVKGAWIPFRDARGLKNKWEGGLTLAKVRKSYGAKTVRELQQFACLPAGEVYTPVVRLNGTSDLPWESTSLMSDFGHLRFYDYTKSHTRMMRFLDKGMPKNYHLTFSFGGTNDHRIPEILAAGGNVTMVFHGKPPTSFGGDVEYVKPDGSIGVLSLEETPVINGDNDDLRFLDPIEKHRRWPGRRQGVIVGLRYKTVTDAVQAAKVAVLNDPFRGWVHDAGDRPRYESNPARCAIAPVGAHRFGCGGAYPSLALGKE